MTWLLLLGAGLFAAWALAWLTLPRAMPAPAGPDLHAAEIASFRRELHDWDRHA